MKKKKFKLLKYVPADLYADNHPQDLEVHPETEFDAINFSEVELIFEGGVDVVPPILSPDKASTIYIPESEVAMVDIPTVTMDVASCSEENVTTTNSSQCRLTSSRSFPHDLAMALATPTTTAAREISQSISNTNLINVVSPFVTPLSLVTGSTSVTNNNQVNVNIVNNKSGNEEVECLDNQNSEETDNGKILCVYCQKILKPNNVANHMKHVHNKTVKNTVKIVKTRCPKLCTMAGQTLTFSKFNF